MFNNVTFRMMLSAKGKQGNHKSPDLTHFTISKHIKLGLRALEGLRSSACSGAVCGHWSANGLLCPFSKWHDESIKRVYCRTWTIWYHHKKKEFYVFNPIRSQGEKPSLTFDKILWFENVCWGRLLLFSLARQDVNDAPCSNHKPVTGMRNVEW